MHALKYKCVCMCDFCSCCSCSSDHDIKLAGWTTAASYAVSTCIWTAWMMFLSPVNPPSMNLCHWKRPKVVFGTSLDILLTIGS